MYRLIRDELLGFSQASAIEKDLIFFQCHKGGYGEGDAFAGVKNPVVQALAKKYQGINLDDVFALLTDSIHEIRLMALYILVLKSKSRKTPESEREIIAQKYLAHLNYVNNWDLVDSSAHHILGYWVYNNSPEVLIQLSKSQNLWENRVAMIATFYHIRQQRFEVPLLIATNLLNHKHDLIHKAVGWMLREIGNRNLDVELNFLKKHYLTMPRTMLRYAIEKFDESLRQQILKGTW